ncbi:hypothetical protein LCGC14_2020640, partial [marine sediment metagenome]
MQDFVKHIKNHPDAFAPRGD